MSDYVPFGPKDGEYKEYEKLHFIRANLDEISDEMVDEYCVPVGRIYRWIIMAVDLRIKDVRQRRAKKAQLRQEREEAIEKEHERVEKRDQEVQEKLEKAIEAQEEAEAKAAEKDDDESAEAEEVPSFDQDAFSKQETDKYDEEYPPVEIPEEVIDDIDNDYNIEGDAEEEEEVQE